MSSTDSCFEHLSVRCYSGDNGAFRRWACPVDGGHWGGSLKVIYPWFSLLSLLPRPRHRKKPPDQHSNAMSPRKNSNPQKS